MEKKEESEGFVPPDGGYGWVIVLSTTLINICLLPLVQNFGIIFEKEFISMGIASAQTSFLLHLHSAIYCSLGLLASPLLKKYDFRKVALLGTALMCTGIFLTSFAQSYTVFICTVSILIGMGQGILLPATYVATNTYFKKRLTLAVAFSVTGASLSSIFMPQICNKLLEHFGRRTTVLVLGAISLVAIVCCFMLRPIQKAREDNSKEMREKDLEENVDIGVMTCNVEEEKEGFLNGQVYKETTLPKTEQEGCFNKIRDLFNLELLRDRPFVIAIIGMAVSYASELNIVLMISFVLPELAQFSREDVALVLSVQSIADVTGRLVVPMIGHYINMSPRVMYGTSLTTSTVGRTIMAIFYGSRPTIFFCAVLLGLAKGTKAVYQSVIIPKYVTLDKLPAANGLSMILTGALSLIIGPVIGAIHDATQTYVYALHTGSVLSMSVVVLWIVHYFIWERAKEEVEELEGDKEVVQAKQ